MELYVDEARQERERLPVFRRDVVMGEIRGERPFDSRRTEPAASFGLSLIMMLSSKFRNSKPAVCAKTAKVRSVRPRQIALPDGPPAWKRMIRIRQGRHGRSRCAIVIAPLQESWKRATLTPI